MALGGGSAASETLPRFPASSVWNPDISSAPVHPDSAAMVDAVADLGGFGNNRMQIDFSIHVVRAPAGGHPCRYQRSEQDTYCNRQDGNKDCLGKHGTIIPVNECLL